MALPNYAPSMPTMATEETFWCGAPPRLWPLAGVLQCSHWGWYDLATLLARLYGLCNESDRKFGAELTSHLETRSVILEFQTCLRIFVQRHSCADTRLQYAGDLLATRRGWARPVGNSPFPTHLMKNHVLATCFFLVLKSQLLEPKDQEEQDLITKIPRRSGIHSTP